LGQIIEYGMKRAELNCVFFRLRKKCNLPETNISTPLKPTALSNGNNIS